MHPPGVPVVESQLRVERLSRPRTPNRVVVGHDDTVDPCAEAGSCQVRWTGEGVREGDSGAVELDEDCGFYHLTIVSRELYTDSMA